MLQVTVILRVVLGAVLVCSLPLGAQEPIVPATVCEVLRDLPAHEGKEIAVLGRYSFRENGLWVGEQSCGGPSDTPAQLWLVEDSQKGPKPPGNYALDGQAVHRKLIEITRRTTLGKFRFGTPDYDRWAVVYGRVEPRKPEDKRAAGNLVFRGSGVVIFVTPEF